jgi:hypothetical protein
MLPTYVSTRIRVLLVVWVLIAGVLLPSRTTVAVSQPALVGTSQDWRHEQVGVWTCHGVSTLEGPEVPYYGHITARWSADGTTLLLRFSEYRAQGKPFRETQRWTYDAATGTHRRYLTTNDGSSGIVVSDGPDGTTMQWEGTFTTPQGTVHLSETLTRVSADVYAWHGVISLGGQELGAYQLTCMKRGH